MAAPALAFRAIETADLAVLRPWLRSAGMFVSDALDCGTWAERLRSDPRIACAAACRGGEVIGFGRLDLAPDRTAEVTVLVGPEARRRGHGRAVLQWALHEARRRGLRLLTALVQPSNRAALTFFREEGFEEAGTGAPGFVRLARVVHRATHRPPLEITP